MVRKNAMGSDEERLASKPAAMWRDLDPPPLEWDESEVCAIVDDIVDRPLFAD